MGMLCFLSFSFLDPLLPFSICSLGKEAWSSLNDLRIKKKIRHRRYNGDQGQKRHIPEDELYVTCVLDHSSISTDLVGNEDYGI